MEHFQILRRIRREGGDSTIPTQLVPFEMPAAGGYARTETPLLISALSDTRATTDLYFGGGHTGLLGKNFYYNLGMFITPQAELNTQTAISSEESSGNFDIQMQMGMAF